MYQKFFTCVVFLFVVSVVQHGYGQGLATLNGKWHVTKGKMNGEDVPADVLASMTLDVKSSGKFTAESGGLTSKGKFAEGNSLDQLIVDIVGGADVGRNLKAKWKMESGSLTIAFSQGDFPSGFDSSKSNKVLVLSYKSGERPVASTGATGRPTAAVSNPAAGGRPGAAAGGRPGGRGNPYPR